MFQMIYYIVHIPKGQYSTLKLSGTMITIWNHPVSVKTEPSGHDTIHEEGQDAWGGTKGKGTGGTVRAGKTTKVYVLDGAKCQHAKLQCQGIYICNQLDQSLLANCQHYSADDTADARLIWEAERELNEKENSTSEASAARFCKEIISVDSKWHFIGCSGWKASDLPNVHRFIPIPINVHEDTLIQLFKDKGKFKKNFRLQRTYTHTTQDGQIIPGTLIHRPCNAIITIYAPSDAKDRHAIVFINSPHNHPLPPATKVSQKDQEKYKDAGRQVAGPSTARRIDRGMIC
ncbi:hypothetical protein C8J56DRAFT_893218 [Mycena floridula]|nr:hypothetical protein C8J56DRAFT_893218 [Mycena floridula]